MFKSGFFFNLICREVVLLVAQEIVGPQEGKGVFNYHG